MQPICESQSRVFPTNRRIVSSKSIQKKKITYQDTNLCRFIIAPPIVLPIPTPQALSFASQYTLLICLVFFLTILVIPNLLHLLLNYLFVTKKQH